MISNDANDATWGPAACSSADNKLGGISPPAHATIERASGTEAPVFNPTEEWARAPLSAGELELIELAVREATGGDPWAGS